MLNNNIFNNLINEFNTNKYILGISMIMMNMGSKYLEIDLKDEHKKFLSSKIIRRLLIFTIAFIATRDILASIIITASFIIIVLNLFDVDSNYCIIPESFRILDTNNDGKISNEEIVNSYNLLKKNGKI